MNQREQNTEAWNATASAQIHQICRQFESEWQAGGQPKIENFLDKVHGSSVADMLRALLRIELKYRGDTPEVDSMAFYCRRFPDHAELVEQLIREGTDRSLHETGSWQDTGRPSCSENAAGWPGGTGSFGRFQFISVLGQGGFGAVYRAYDPHLDRDVALKFPRAGKLIDGVELQRFMREARAAAQLRHSYIVSVYEAGEIDGTYFIVSDLIQGQSLRELIREKRFTKRDAVALLAKLASALAYAHDKGVIHRDIKPENIMIDGDGEPYVMDFGLARRTQGDELITREGSQMGTPAYMSPELAKGKSRDADARTDIWSLGVILYEMLAGRRPFLGGGAEILFEIVGGDPLPLRQLDASVPMELEAISTKCLQKDIERRYATCK